MTDRKQTKTVSIGNRKIGGGNPILIQSMCNTKTEDAEATVSQILALEEAGCDIIRVAVPTMEAAGALKEIKGRFIFRWWRISISTTGWRWLRLRMVRIRSGLILEILGAKSGSGPLWIRQRNMGFPSGSA